MSRERLARIQRVLDARQKSADHVEVELAELTRASAAASAAAERAKGAWMNAMNVTMRADCSSTDLSEAHAYAMTLGHRYDASVREAREALARCEAGRARLRAARVEVRKVELWRSRLTDAQALEAAAAERRSTDEFAARRARSA